MVTIRFGFLSSSEPRLKLPFSSEGLMESSGVTPDALPRSELMAEGSARSAKGACIRQIPLLRVSTISSPGPVPFLMVIFSAFSGSILSRASLPVRVGERWE